MSARMRTVQCNVPGTEVHQLIAIELTPKAQFEFGQWKNPAHRL